MRFLPWLAVLLALVAGCGRKEEVRRYKAPKDPVWRMIGAIVPGKDSTWFFKVVAPGDRMSAEKEGILAFLKGLRSEGSEIRWTNPAGWTMDADVGPGRQACLHFGDREPKLEMTVVRLPGDGGGLAANVNRWIDQLGGERATEAAVVRLVEKVAATNLEIQVVDLVGPNRPSGGPRAMPRPAETPRGGDPSLEKVRSMFSFERPPEWKENPSPDKPRIFEFRVEGGALVTFTMMGAAAGSVADNIDRWRTQAGLDPQGESGVNRSATPIQFTGSEAWLVDLVGPERAILGVISLGPQFSMFLKMDGPPSVVTAQRSTFARVAQSFKMRGRDE